MPLELDVDLVTMGDFSSPSVSIESQSLQVRAVPSGGVLALSSLSSASSTEGIRFSTPLSRYRPGTSDSFLVRPAFPDREKFIELTNDGNDPLRLTQIVIHAPDVSVDVSLTASPQDDIVLAPGATQRFQLTYAPTTPNLLDSSWQSFDVSAGLVIHTDSATTPTLEVRLRGESTFDSDITYDGNVNLAELGVLRVNYLKNQSDPTFDHTADINGDGAIHLGDLGPLRRQFLLTRNQPLLAESPALADSRQGVVLEDDAESLRPLAAAASQMWQAPELAAVQVVVQDLGGRFLGLASTLTNTIFIDDDAAGYGWDTGSGRGMDLLTVLAHEMGHLLGLTDLPAAEHPHDIMADVLSLGQRRRPVLGELLEMLSTEVAEASDEYLSAADCFYTQLGES
jgi:hypothetical protein